MADEPDPLDQLLDAALYVPLGLWLELREQFPELAERGRQHLQSQVTVARVVGRFAVQMGSKQVAAFLERQRDASSSDEPSAAEPAEAAAPSPARPSARATAPGRPEALAIAGYDTLAASQIVARLDGLDAASLEAVRAYEVAHRNRKTVLGKVTQLQRSA